MTVGLHNSAALFTVHFWLNAVLSGATESTDVALSARFAVAKASLL